MRCALFPVVLIVPILNNTSIINPYSKTSTHLLPYDIIDIDWHRGYIRQ